MVGFHIQQMILKMSKLELTLQLIKIAIMLAFFGLAVIYLF